MVLFLVAIATSLVLAAAFYTSYFFWLRYFGGL
jgi:hypothetical protein